MRVNCGLSWLEKIEAQKEWHPFYPWWPRRVAANDCRCFEWIERRITFKYIFKHVEYRLKKEENGKT